MHFIFICPIIFPPFFIFYCLLLRPTNQRRDIWIENSGNEELRNVPLKVRKYFCESHFDPKYIRKQFTRTTLSRDAVPYKYEDKTKGKLRMSCLVFIVILICNSSSYFLDKRKTYTRTDNRKSIFKKTNAKKVKFENIHTGSDEESTSETDEMGMNKTFVNMNDAEEVESEIEAEEVTEIEMNNEAVERIGAQSFYHNRRNRLRLENEIHSEADEVQFFALSIVGDLKRLTPQNRSIAKCHITQYLADLKYGDKLK